MGEHNHCVLRVLAHCIDQPQNAHTINCNLACDEETHFFMGTLTGPSRCDNAMGTWMFSCCVPWDLEGSGGKQEKEETNEKVNEIIVLSTTKQ